VEDGKQKTISAESRAPDTPVNTELVSTPLMSHAGERAVESGLCEPDKTETSVNQDTGVKNLRSPRNVILEDVNRMMEEIDVATLVQKELIRTEPYLASAASFLSVVSG